MNKSPGFNRPLCRLAFCFLAVASAAWVPVTASGPQKASPAKARPVLEKESRVTQTQIDDAIADDPAVTRFVNGYGKTIKVKLSEIVTHSPEEIRRGEGGGTVGKLVADAMRFEASRLTKRPGIVAISNTGGVRGDLPAGDIKVRDVFNIMPFENKLVVLDLVGDALMKSCERFAFRYGERGGFPVSGMTLRIKGGKLVEAKIGGTPIDPKGVYTIVTSDYLYAGGDGYSFSEATNVQHLKVTLRDAIIGYMRSTKPFVVPNDQRVVVESDSEGRKGH